GALWAYLRQRPVTGLPTGGPEGIRVGFACFSGIPGGLLGLGRLPRPQDGKQLGQRPDPKALEIVVATGPVDEDPGHAELGCRLDVEAWVVPDEHRLLGRNPAALQGESEDGR